MAKELTEFNPDGSIKVAGFVPWFGYYVQRRPLEPRSHVRTPSSYNDDGTAGDCAPTRTGRRCSSGRRTSSTVYGADNAASRVRRRPGRRMGRGEPGLPARPHRDGDRRRVADRLHQADTPDLNYGTAPLPGARRPGRSLRIGRGRRDDHRHPERIAAEPGRGMAAREVHGDEHRHSRLSGERRRQRADDLRRRSSHRTCRCPSSSSTFLDVLQHPDSHYKDMSVLGSPDQDLGRASRRSGRRAKRPTSKRVSQDVAQQIDDQLAQAAGCRKEERSPAHVDDGGAGGPSSRDVAGAPAPARRYGTVLPVHVAVDHRVRGLHRCTR